MLSKLAPAEAIERSEWLQSALIAMGGFSVILSEFVRPTNGGFVEKYSKYVALHIIRFMLFGTEGTTSGSYVMDQVQQLSSDITQTLLWLACDAAAVENLVAVQNSLLTIIYLLQSSVVVRQLISSPQTKALLLDVLKSPSQRVREVAVDFAVQVGKSQPSYRPKLLKKHELSSIPRPLNSRDSFLGVGNSRCSASLRFR